MLKRLKGRVRNALKEGGHHLRARKRLYGIGVTEPILIYQMGKVGSSSVVRTLHGMGMSDPILHVHTLNPDSLERAIYKHRMSTSRCLPEHLITSSLLVRKLQKGRFPCRVITLTREPIGRAISFAFEDWQKKAYSARGKDGTLDPSIMHDAVVNLLRGKNGHSDPSRWFNSELRKVLGIDVFSRPYDFERGYVVFDEGPVSVLLIRMEDLDRSLGVALNDFIGVQVEYGAIQRANESGQSWYAKTYREVKEAFRLPSNLIDRVLDTPYARHFYGNEREALRRKWSTRSG